MLIHEGSIRREPDDVDETPETQRRSNEKALDTFVSVTDGDHCERGMGETGGSGARDSRGPQGGKVCGP
jgi:hypothetical protein